MKISIHSKIKTKFVHAEELELRKKGYLEAINYHKIDIDANHLESDIVKDLIHELNGTSRRLLIDCMPVALDDAGHDILLIDIYDTEVHSIDAVKQIFNKYANKLCDDSKLHFESRPKNEEFQLLVTQKN